MSLPADVRDALRIPAVCAPMLGVSEPGMIVAACKAGLMAGLPRHNAANLDQFEVWLETIHGALCRHRDLAPDSRIGPLAVNLSARLSAADASMTVNLARRYGIRTFISARGDPTDLAKCVHDRSARLFHDVTNMRFAEKAIAAGVDGIVCLASGGGGHSGNLSAFALVPCVRAMFAGTILLGGAISTGHGIRAAQILGADLAYIGTRFIATQEAKVAAAYKSMLVRGRAEDVVYSPAISGTSANWLADSLRISGIDPDLLTQAGYLEELAPPTGKRPWRDLWSAGQGIALIDAIDPLAIVVDRLAAEYQDACKLPAFGT